MGFIYLLTMVAGYFLSSPRLKKMENTVQLLHLKDAHSTTSVIAENKLILYVKYI